MALVGTIPSFEHGFVAGPGTDTVVTITGAASGSANGTASTESIRAFYVRAAAALSLSGVLATAPAGASGLQAVSGSIVSGLRNLQRELAARIADIDYSGASAATRLTAAQQNLSVAGEVQFGS